MSKTYISGQHGDYYWIEFPANIFGINELIKSHAASLIDKYLPVVCFDSGLRQ